jgi:hypothetical protein
MFRLMVVLSAIIVLHGVNSHNFPKQLLKVTKNVQPLKHIKRQDFNINDECFGEELNKRSPECVSKFFAAGLPDDLDSFASIVCSSDCGQIVLDSLRACGATRAEARLFADLCGTNSDGVVCYSIFADFAESEEDDVDVCPSTETCPSTCQSTLTQVVNMQGCCFDVLFDFGRATEPDLFNQLQEQFDSCNIDLPDNCNNSPVSGGKSFFQVSGLAIISALLLISVLG